MQGIFGGAFQGEKKDILALLTKLGEERTPWRSENTTHQIIFNNVLLPDNWTQLIDNNWTKVFYGSQVSLNITYILKGEMFKELRRYTYPLECAVMVTSLDSKSKYIVYSGYLSDKTCNFRNKREMKPLLNEYEKLMGCSSVMNDEMDAYGIRTKDIADIIPIGVIPPRARKITPKFVIDVKAIMAEVESKNKKNKKMS